MRTGGALRSEYAGISSKKAGENPVRRKPKVSWATRIVPGLVGPKARPKGVTDGQQVNIPVLRKDRPRVFEDSFVSLCDFIVIC